MLPTDGRQVALGPFQLKLGSQERGRREDVHVPEEGLPDHLAHVLVVHLDLWQGLYACFYTWESFPGSYRAPLKGFGADMRQVRSEPCGSFMAVYVGSGFFKRGFRSPLKGFGAYRRQDSI